MEKNKVAVSNLLVRASYKLNITEKRLLLCFISRISPNKELNPDWFYSLNLKEYIKLYGLKEKTAIAQIKKAIETLADQKVFLRRGEGFKDIEFNWVSCKPELLEDNYTVGIKWSKEVIPFISKQNKFFTSYPLKNVSNFRSFYAHRIYEYILCDLGKNHKNLNHVPYISIEDFLFMMNIDEDKYTSFSNFNANVLKPAIHAINRDTDIAVEAKPYKRGRKAIGIRFIVVK